MVPHAYERLAHIHTLVYITFNEALQVANRYNRHRIREGGKDCKRNDESMKHNPMMKGPPDLPHQMPEAPLFFLTSTIVNLGQETSLLAITKIRH